MLGGWTCTTAATCNAEPRMEAAPTRCLRLPAHLRLLHLPAHLRPRRRRPLLRAGGRPHHRAGGRFRRAAGAQLQVAGDLEAETAAQCLDSAAATIGQDPLAVRMAPLARVVTSGTVSAFPKYKDRCRIGERESGGTSMTHEQRTEA